jgi:hypothetical protein
MKNRHLMTFSKISLVGVGAMLGLVASTGLSQQKPPSSAASTTLPTAEAADPKLRQMLGAGASTGTAPASTEGARPLAAATSVTSAATTRPGVAPGVPVTNVLREGSLIIDRTGRIVRTPDGSQVEFVFDADGQALRDAPVIVLPNLTLMKMEQAATGVNRDLRFRITGMVTEYRGRNYVLLDKAMVVPDADGRF